jgi:hypothetical protein
MPLIKSASKQAFGENIARERAAGKPGKQAVAIAYSEKRLAEHHSGHSKARSAAYHSKNVEPNFKRHESTMMSKLDNKPQSLEDVEEKGHKL